MLDENKSRVAASAKPYLAGCMSVGVLCSRLLEVVGVKIWFNASPVLSRHLGRVLLLGRPKLSTSGMRPRDEFRVVFFFSGSLTG